MSLTGLLKQGMRLREAAQLGLVLALVRCLTDLLFPILYAVIRNGGAGDNDTFYAQALLILEDSTKSGVLIAGIVIVAALLELRVVHARAALALIRNALVCVLIHVVLVLGGRMPYVSWPR